MDLRTGGVNFDYDGFDITLILASILLHTRPAESWSGSWQGQATADVTVASFSAAALSPPAILRQGFIFAFFIVDVLHSERRERSGLIGL